MARKPVSRSLPPLRQLHPDFRGFAPDQNQAAAVLIALRQTAEHLRQASAIPFYSMLEVAAFFGVSYRTVARAYAKLEAEGLLSRIRGSQTLLLPAMPRPQSAIRGVVGVPIWMPGFLVFRDWRFFIVQLEAALRRRQYVADLIFYTQGEEVSPNFPERVLAHRPDHLIWLCPDGADRQPMELLKDAGLAVTVVADRPTKFPGRVYRLDWSAALATGLRAWQREGMQQVVVPAAPGCDRPATSATHVLLQHLERARIPHSFPAPGVDDVAWGDYVDGLAREPSVGVIFDEDSWYDGLCGSVPHAMLRLFRRARVMVLRHVVLPNVRRENAVVDFLHMDWAAIAARVAQDLDTPAPATPLTFEAEWWPRTPIAAVSQSFRWE